MNRVEISGINTSSLPRLSGSEQTELLKRIAAGDETARETFLIANVRLVLSVVKKFYGKRADADDIFQAGCIGLIKATDNFNSDLNVQFSTYAVPMIIGEIRRNLRTSNSLRIPRSIRDTAYKALKARERLEYSGKEARPEDVAEELGVAVFDVTYAMDAISDTVSLYDPVYSDNGDELLLMDQVTDGDKAEDEAVNKLDLKKALALLPERERKIVTLRYFMGKTQTEISEEVGISQAQVSRLEKNALKEMKKKIS
ncbi:MAG TPA: RNA polymerase sigma-G factor [Clostridiales bacterium]|nr:RNA polymerase sigma-G factor [Clostridiales bacterium]